MIDKKLILQRIKESNNLKTDRELADFLGISKSTLSNWYYRDSIDYDLVFSKCEYVDKNWLLTGNYSKQSHNDLKNYPDTHDYVNKISEPDPVYGHKSDLSQKGKQLIPLFEVNANAGLNTIFSSDGTQVPIDYILVPNAPKCDGALYVRGDSMYPSLRAGDIICYKIIHDINNIIFGEMYILDIDNNGDQFLAIKYVQKSDKGDQFVKLISENKHHADKNEPIQNIRALGIIKLTIRYNTIS